MSEEYDEEEAAYDDAEMRAEINQDIVEGYGSPQPEEKINQFKIFNDAINKYDTTRVTYLTKGELGRPLFSVRFYLQCYKRALAWNAPLVAEYFKKRAGVITDSGMSNEGFMMRLPVSSNRNVKRTHVKSDSQSQKENTGE